MDGNLSGKSIFIPQRDALLLALEERAGKDYIPIIEAEVGQFLQLLIRAVKPRRILEIGTAIGYSTIWMARALAEEAELVTIEKDEDMYLAARENFQVAGLGEKIRPKFGDALEVLPLLGGEFDFVFIDAAKGQYLNYLELVLDQVPGGGLIIADNVLYRGYVRKSGRIAHKRRTMVRALQEYIEVIQEHPCLDSMILPLGDGLALSVKKSCPED